MLSISDAKSPDEAKDYYERDNYYLKGDAGEIQSVWWGKGAELLGLSGAVDGDAFVDLLSGKLPDGKLLGITKQGEHLHRPGYDFTFSAPKSISILAEIGGDRRLVEAHDQAVNMALGDIEQLATARRSVSGTMHYETTGNLAVAKFKHGTSRALDPQLHTHAVVLNMTQRQDGQFRSFASQSKESVQKEGRLGFMEQAYARKLHFGAVYRAALAQSVVKLGYNIRVMHNDGRFEIEGVPEAAIKTFSKRREDIEAALEARGLVGAKASEKAALMTRQHKKQIDKATLMANWKAEIKDLGLNVEGIIQEAKQREVSMPQKSQADIQAIAIEAVNYARLHLSERQAAFLKDDLKEVASTHALGVVGPGDIDTAIDVALKEGSLILGKHQGALMLTTLEAKALETENIALMQRAKGTVKAISDFHHASPFLWDAGLNKDQFNAASLILTTTDGVVGVQGYAGTGKTTMLRAVNEFADLMGLTVRGMAPTAVAAAELGKNANIQSQTLDSFLIDLQKRDDETHAKTGVVGETQDLTRQQNNVLSPKQHTPPAAKELWVLDEFSLTASRPMGELLKQREALGAHMVILGDIQQLGGVEAGKPGEQLQEAGMATAVMRTIVRQRNSPDLMEAVYAIIGEDVPHAINKLKDSIYEIADKDERLRSITKDYLQLTPKERKDTLISAPANQDREILNNLIREGLKAQGHLQGPDIQTDILINKSLTLVEKTRAKMYERGNIVKFGKDIGDFKKHQYYEVVGRDVKENLVKLKSANTEFLFSPVKHGGGTRGVISVFEVGKRELAQGDVIRWTMNQKHLKRLNSTTGVVQSINKKRAKVLDVNGYTHVLKLNDKRDQHLEYAHVWTVYASQSKTLKYVLGHDESKRKFLTNQKNFYVTISRAEIKASLYIDDKQAYIAKLQDSLGDKVAALELQPIQDKVAPQFKQTAPLSTPTNASQLNHHNHPKPTKTYQKSTSTPHHNMTKPKEKRIYDVIRLHERLAAMAPHVVEKLLGEPSRQLSNVTTWRYGKKGSLAVTVQGNKAGLWHDFETGEKGNLLTLISQTAGLTRTQTHEVAADLIGASLSTFETTLPTFTHQKAALPEVKIPSLDDQKAIDYAKQLIQKSASIEGTLAQSYLSQHRRITLDKFPSSLRFLSSIKHSGNGQYLPALLSIATNEKGETQAVQVTYLNPTTHNKAMVTPNKVQYGRMRFGAHVLLQTGTGNTKEVLVAEGVETALSLAQAKPEATVIATLSVSNMKNIKLPERAETITICADNDKGKEHALALLQKAIPHLKTQTNKLNLAIPDTHQTDFNDVLKQSGVHAVKEYLDKTETLFNPNPLEVKSAISAPTQALQKPLSMGQSSMYLSRESQPIETLPERLRTHEKHTEQTPNMPKYNRTLDHDLEL